MQIAKTLELILQAFRDLFIRFLPQSVMKFLVREKGEFAFLVHPRNFFDIASKYKFIKYFPRKLVKFFAKHLWPVVCSEIVGLKNKEGKEIRGWIIGYSMLPHQILKNRRLAKKRILQSIKLAEKLGVKIMGLGALSSSLTHGGLDLIDNKIKIGLTTGNSYTAAVIIEDIKKIVSQKNIDLKSIQIAIIGATGSIGQAVSKILAAKTFSLILIGRSPEHLDGLKKAIYEINKEMKPKISTNIQDIIEADLVIVATSATEVIIKAEHLKEGAIVYDVTQPRNVCPEITEKRKDVLMIDGGLVKTPGINFHFNLGIPRETAFACLAETMILAAESKFNHYSLGKVKVNQVEKIDQLAKKYNFESVIH